MQQARNGGARRVARRIGVAVAASLLVAAAVALPAGPVTAQNAATCHFADAGSGTYARTLCWFDLSGYDAAAATSAAGQPMTFALPGGYTVGFTLHVTGGAVKATTLPTYNAAYLGNDGFYSGIEGEPALYQTANGTDTTATLTDITATDSTGVDAPGYALVGADAESTDENESITWTASDALQSLTATTDGDGLGNACGGGFSGVGTTQVTCTGNPSPVGLKTGTPIVSATHPTSFSQQMHGGGLEGVAFGVLVSTVQVTKQIDDGFGGDAFRVSVLSHEGSVLGTGAATADTAGTGSGTTGEVTVLTSPQGTPYRVVETPEAGTLATNYDRSWSCTRDGEASSGLPTSGAGDDNAIDLGIGDLVECTVTNTGLAHTIALVKHAGIPTDVNGDGLVDAGDTIPYTFTVTNTGAVAESDVQVSDAKAGAVTCPPVELAAGASMTCTADAPYVITAADVQAGSVDNTATASAVPAGTTATVTSPSASTQTATVTPHPAFTVAKTASATVVHPGDRVTYAVTVANTGNSAFTAASPATFTDDLAGVLDDTGAVSDVTDGATVSGHTLRWSGALAVGATTTVRYTVTVRTHDEGDAVLVNRVTPGPHGTVAPGGRLVTTTRVRGAATGGASGPVVQTGGVLAAGGAGGPWAPAAGIVLVAAAVVVLIQAARRGRR